MNELVTIKIHEQTCLESGSMIKVFCVHLFLLYGQLNTPETTLRNVNILEERRN
jgi:hypothetical protein